MGCLFSARIEKEKHRRLKLNMSENIRDKSYKEYFEQCALDCDCCPHCWEVPCGSCLAGGICDNICRCEEDEYEPYSTEDDIYP